MRKHGWQLPYHPLQVVAISVFVALGFGFYVFFAPFVGKQLYEFILMGIYTPFLICSVGLYIWCAAEDPADPGVFRSKQYLNILENMNYANAATSGEKVSNKEKVSIKSGTDSIMEPKNKISTYHRSNRFACVLSLFPCAYICDSNDESSDQQSEDGMFYCSLCQVEVCKHSKHCRVCNKCVNQFDHHCRWLNNCIGKRNYRKFFTLMVSALILLVLQWSTGILVLILCFLDRKQFATDISSKLGSSFTMVPFVIVVAVCTILAMIATVPLSQLFFFHILLIKKGISTYDYIIALREQEQQGGGDRQSPQMSPVSSFTGLSSVSSFNTFNRGSWCTPPRMFVENQLDALGPDNVSVSSLGKRTTADEHVKKKNLPAPVKISPWTLARLNTEEVSKAAAEARKKSKILSPIATRQHERGNSFGSSHRTTTTDDNRKHICLPAEPLSNLPILDPKISTNNSTGFLAGIVPSSPESSLELESPELRPLGVTTATATAMGSQREGPLSRSTSDGYDASGGEDSDQVSTRIVHRSSDWRSLLVGLEMDRQAGKSTGMERRRH